MTVPARWRAPREDRAVLADPPLAMAGNLLAENRRRLSRTDILILGRPLPELRRQTRLTVLDLARAYLQAAGEPLPETPPLTTHHSPTSDYLLVSGHQPEIFHPGVWLKNFALHGLARQHQGTSLNLIVDTDTAKSTVLRLPAWPEGSQRRGVPITTHHSPLTTHRSPLTINDGLPYRAQVPFDVWQGDVPYEEREVRDESIFASLAERVRPLTERWGFAPLLPVFWTEAIAQVKRTLLLGERLAAARRFLERRWGCHNLEVPMSLLCGSEPFAWFACQVLDRLEEFHAIYNEVVRDYRRRRGIRSLHHPVPDLAQDGDWLELPFWAWKAGQKRRRLFGRRSTGAFRLRAGNEEWPSLQSPTRQRGPDHLVRSWLELSRDGHKIRSRALTTTLFARLFLADLFVHGIGGALYDELTDEIMRRFFGIEPPSYLVLSATLLLPFSHPLTTPPSSPQDCRRLAQLRRDLFYNPQRHLQEIPAVPEDARRLAAEKLAWIARSAGNREQRWQRHRMLHEVNRQLRPFLAARDQELQRQEEHGRRQVAANQVLARRDYGFCLYPEDLLREFYMPFL